MALTVIGVTTESSSIARMLGVEKESDYGIYQETTMGRYYARFISDGTFDDARLVRLVSYEQAAELDASAIASIKHSSATIKELMANWPSLDMAKFHENMERISRETAEKARQMGQDIRDNLERAGFHPTFG